ncbi:MAG: TIGR04255 family protein [Candidatus Riflebacteria bacterium]|nr:TIGR04255 family protein [Candidatus Riflebacteria bacterium]
MTRRIYPKPPIVEAVVELRFVADNVAETLLEALGGKLSSQYPGDRKIQELVETSGQVSPESVRTASRRTPHVTFLRSSDGVRLIGCGAKTMSVHNLAPYAGWESFFEQIEEAVAAVPSGLRGGGLEAISVRYIDRMTLPAGGHPFTDYLTIMPPCPGPMPSEIAEFHVVTQTMDSTDSSIALLTLASAPPTPEGRPVLLHDLHLHRRGTPLCGVDDRGWVDIVNALHERQRDVFEASITDKMRELFQ